jgi:hypothetical protein
MGLKSFLKEQGFIADDSHDNKKESSTSTQQSATTVTPTYFPVLGGSSSGAEGNEPSFVTPLKQNTTVSAGGGIQPDPQFIKFFEDELTKTNLPGPDYFEFRQMLIKTQQKMASKGMVAPEVVLQAVLTSFEAQNVSTAKLIEAARIYKENIRNKNEEFLKGAAAEKNNQLQKRQAVLQQHDETLKKIQQQIAQIDQQRKQLEDQMNKERTQQEVDKTLGKEGIERIEKAEKLIAVAHDYMQSTIDQDIQRLQSV